MSLINIKQSIVLASERAGIDPFLTESIVEVESNYNELACRYEPAVGKYVLQAAEHAKNNNISAQTEVQLQMFSFGLMQIMGFKLREMGHKGTLLECLDVDINLLYGTRFLAQLFGKYGNELDVIASYNAGSPRHLADNQYVNSAYVNKVSSILKRKREGKNGTH